MIIKIELENAVKALLKNADIPFDEKGAGLLDIYDYDGNACMLEYSDNLVRIEYTYPSSLLNKIRTALKLITKEVKDEKDN